MDIEQAPKLAMNNKEQVVPGVSCGCYFCLTAFDGGEVDEWADNGTTALCPRCSIDSVLVGVDIDELVKAHERWFAAKNVAACKNLRFKALSGFSWQETVEPPDFLYRDHRSMLCESLLTVKKMSSMADLKKHVFSFFGEGEIAVKKYVYDRRIEWDTYIVTHNGRAVGFTNGAVEDPDKCQCKDDKGNRINKCDGCPR